MFDLETIFRNFYERADRPEDLPWHIEQLPPLLDAYLEGYSERLSILDLGSGSGLFAVEMARRGHDVTGLDFIEDAIEMSRKRADRADLDVEFVHADVLEWESAGSFDVVVDSGLFHGLSEEQIQRYNDRLLQRVTEGGSYFLSHFVKRHPFDWRPIGPYRRSSEALIDCLPDELSLRTDAYKTVYPPFPVGPSARMGHFWFKRP